MYRYIKHSIEIEYIKVPGGFFLMGSPDNEEGRDWYKYFDKSLNDNVESPRHLVKISDFLMSKYLITQAQWKMVASLPIVYQEIDPDPSYFKGDSLPVEQISWLDSMEFCARLSRYTNRNWRLPSESEWEYACRGGTYSPFSFGQTLTKEVANYHGTDWEYQGRIYPGSYGGGPLGINRQATTEIGAFPPNAFGLFDMHGNLWEWCLDHWHPNYFGKPNDGKSWLSVSDSRMRVLRGGSWHSNPWSCRSAHRYSSTASNPYLTFGLRVACSQKTIF